MSPLVKKEIRLLLPSFLISFLLALSIWLLPEHLGSKPGIINSLLVFPYLFSPAMLTMLAVNSFGGEFGSGTFSMLLAQPVFRARIWRTKTLLLGVAVLLVWFAWCGSAILSNQINANLREMEISTALFALAVYSGGLWTVLLLRSVAAALWFTVLTPAALLMTLSNLLNNYPHQVVTEILIFVFIVYGIAGFLFARWLFWRAQDLAWTGGSIAMPEMSGLAWLKLHSGVRRMWRPRAALFIKEIQLHQSQFVIAGVLALLHLGAIATRKFGNFNGYPDLKFVLEHFWWLWAVMPFLVGCAAVAEERKLGTLEGQLCLPVKRRTQFSMKLFVALSLSVVLGTIMPLLLEGGKILPDIHFNVGQILAGASQHGYFIPTTAGIIWLTLLNILASFSPFLPFFCLVVISAGIASISFYASTLTRNTLQTLAPAVLGILAAWLLLLVAAVPEEIFKYPLWHGWLIYLIGVPTLLAVLATLAYWNYQRALVGWNVWRRNLFTMLISLALVITATTAIYQRAWELLTPLEPPHGAARLLNSTKMRADSGDFAVFLPDGRVWLNRYSSYQPNPFLETSAKVTQDSFFGGGRFLDGTNWTDVADVGMEIVGIQRDGSLWVSEKPKRRMVVHWGLGEKPAPVSTKLVRFGNDHDWKNVAGGFVTPFLLKTDGTLWIWGTNRFNWRREWPGLRAYEPQRLGTNSDWSEIFVSHGRQFFGKTDGQMWTCPPFSDQDPKLALGHYIVLGRAQFENLNGTVYGFGLGVREDGTFRILVQQHWNQQSRHIDWEAINFTIGHETNWVSATSSSWKMVTLKRDGSLWLWNFQMAGLVWNQEILRNFQNTVPVRLGAHSDWIAIGQMSGRVVSLAADGSLWLWQFEPSFFFHPENSQIPPLLSVSRKPELLGNIFDQSN